MDVDIDAGAEDVESGGETATVYTSPGDLEAVRAALLDAGFELASAEIIMKPANMIEIDDAETAAKLLKLIDALEDNDDVRAVYANYDISDELLETLES